MLLSDVRRFAASVAEHSGLVIGSAAVAAVMFAWTLVQAVYFGAASPWTAILLITAVLLLLLACFLAWRDQANKRQYFENELRALKVSNPRIEFIRVDHRMADIINGESPPSITGSMQFFHLLFANSPNTPNERVTAVKVIGFVSFYRDAELTECLLGPQLHRWADAPAPGKVGKIADYLGQFDLEPNRLPCRLDLFFKRPDENDCYTHTNETTMTSEYEDLRDPKFRISSSECFALVRLCGLNVDKEFVFEVTEIGRGKWPVVRLLRSRDNIGN